MTKGSLEGRAGRNINKYRMKGEELPAWFPPVEKRVEESLPLLRPAERKILEGHTGIAESEREAARSARDLKDHIEATDTAELRNYKQLSKAFEVFVALGIRGKMLDPKDPKSKAVPGWLGQNFPDISLTDAEADIFYGMDFLLRTTVDGKEIMLGGDVTFSDKKLEEKIGKIKKHLIDGTKTPTSSDPKAPRALRLVVGISNEQMREALMAWGRDTNRIEAYDARALGACVREQIVTQLQKYAEYAAQFRHEELASEYRALLGKIQKVAPHVPERRQSLAGDSLNQAILDAVKGIDGIEALGK